MAGRGNWNDLDAGNIDLPKSRDVHVQDVPHADRSSAAPDRAFSAAKRLDQKPDRDRGEFRVEIAQQRYQPLARQHAIDDERHFRLELIEETLTRARRMSPHRWLLARRVDKAASLLAVPDLTLAGIALACGFWDQSHFTRVFKASTGMSPGRWRRFHMRGPKLSQAPTKSAQNPAKLSNARTEIFGTRA